MNLPKHKFWGAGEPECPPELKAPNGELHTMRCKVCGDGWRKSGNVCLPLDPARLALAELVACKELKDRAEAIAFAGPLSEHGENWKAEYDRMRADYLRRQPLAWEAARSALDVKGCPNAAHMGEHACKDRSQCWEPCGELGHSEEHVRVGRDDPAKAAFGVKEDQRG